MSSHIHTSREFVSGGFAEAAKLFAVATTPGGAA